MHPTKPSDPPPLPSRRAFLVSSGGVAAAAASAVAFPQLLLASKTAPGAVTVGEGEHRYECLHDWGRDSLPEGHHYGRATHGVAIDRDGFLYLTHHGGPDSVFVFDPEGRFVRSLGGEFVAAQREGQAASCFGHGIDIREEGGEEFLYLSPNHPTLFFAKMAMDGSLVWTKDRAEVAEESGVFDGETRFNPTNASFRPDGGYYLGDGYGSHYLFEYDREDRFVRAIGGQGSEQGQFATPHGQWLDDRDGVPKLVVADRANRRLQWFGMDGAHLKTLEGFLFPADIDARGEVLLVPDLHARVTLLGADDEVLAQLGDDEAWRERVLDPATAMRSKPELWEPGRFVHPHDACFDAEGNIFLAEWVVGGRLTKLRRVG